jgi:carboxyl-terminal processing protease
MNVRGRLFIALVSTVLIGYIAVGSLLNRVMGDSTYGQLAVFNEVVRLVLEAYVEPVNLDRAMAGARLGLTEALDGDSAYLDSEEFRAHQQPAKDAEAETGLLITRRFSFLMVVSVRPGSPAQKADVRPGDAIKTIDGRHTRPITAPVGQRLLRGAPGSVVKLTLLRPGSEPVEVSLVREKLGPVPARAKMLEDGTGYLKVPELPARAVEDVRSELESLKKSGARRLVLDLRGAGHGVPAEGVKLAELFLKGGTVATLKGEKAAEETISADPSRQLWSLPLAVLVDTGTAGPGEIAAAALLESERAPVVGEHTFGRAGVQKTVALAEGGLVITVAKYFSPKGNPIHGRGVTPSFAVDQPDPEDEDAATGRDPVLEKALELLKGEQKKAA